ncbi:MAG TPA: pyrroline-5-carboxylate reductase [Chthoniobacterales bacterium]|nr:pyrroline-5-carboxylate reductase [Chthoniobacterales bacterium]
MGAGKLAGSVMRGLLRVGFCAAHEIIASEPNEKARTQLQTELGIETTTNSAEAAARADVILLGVKPGVVLPLLREMAETLDRKLVVSFAAGIRIASMEAVTTARIMRVMTNTPSAIARAATAYAAGRRATNEDRANVRAMFSAIGVAVEVDDDQIDAVTALAGSGPAFVYTMIEALARGAIATGLSQEAALKLAAQTALGAAELTLTSGLSPEELRRMVVTPGGTTAAGLAEMEKRSAASAISAAVEAAAARGREMAQEFA